MRVVINDDLQALVKGSIPLEDAKLMVNEICTVIEQEWSEPDNCQIYFVSVIANPHITWWVEPANIAEFLEV